MAGAPDMPAGVTDQESADAFLDAQFSGEAPDLEPEAPDHEESDQLEEEDSAQPRDELGRFASQDAEEDDQETLDDEELPPESTDESPESAAEGEAAQESEFVSDEEWDALPSMQYRADGQAWEIPGSKVYDDGVYIPTEQIGAIQQLLQEGHAHRGSFRQTLAARDTRIRELEVELEAGQQAFNEISSKIEELITNPGAFEQWIENQRGNWDALQAKANAAKAQRQLEAREARLEEIERQQQEAALIPQMQDRVAQAVGHFGQQAGFDQATMQQIYDRMIQPNMLQQIFPVGEDGGRLEDLQIIANHVLYLKQIGAGTAVQPQPVQDPPPAQQKTASQQPAKRAAPARRRRTPPKTVSGKQSGGSPPPQRKAPQVPKFASTEEADAWLERGGYNDLIE